MRDLLVFWILGWGLFTMSAAAGPLLVEIEPNAILEMKNGELPPLTVEVRNLDAGATLRLQVVTRCALESDPRPDCPALYERDSQRADHRGVLRDRISPEVLAELRPNTLLWLRVLRRGGAEPRAPQTGHARFMITDNPCTLFETVIEAFFGGQCDPGLRQALRRHRGPSGLEEVTFEVRHFAVPDKIETGRMGVDPARIRTVAGSRGATGVAWESRDKLLVTIASTTQGADSTAAGVYRIDLSGKKRELLWTPPADDDRPPTAPLALPGGRVAFVRQTFSGDMTPGEPSAWLNLWCDGRILEEVPLLYRIHQLVAFDAPGERILALSLGLGANRPAFLIIDLESVTAQAIGYDHAVYNSAMRSHVGSRAAVAFEDNAGRFGWEIVLVDKSGRWLRDLVHRREHDLLPTWSPGGNRLAYLAEVERMGIVR